MLHKIYNLQHLQRAIRLRSSCNELRDEYYIRYWCLWVWLSPVLMLCSSCGRDDHLWVDAKKIWDWNIFTISNFNFLLLFIFLQLHHISQRYSLSRSSSKTATQTRATRTLHWLKIWSSGTSPHQMRSQKLKSSNSSPMCWI